MRLRALPLASRALSPVLTSLSSHQESLATSQRCCENPTKTRAGLTSVNNVEASSSSRTRRPNSDYSPRSDFYRNRCIRPIDHDYFSRVLLRKDWFLLLNQELRAKRIVLNSQFVVSVLQNLENPLHPLKFYIWLSNIDSLFARDQSVKRALTNSLYRKGPVVLSVELLKEIIDSGCRVTEELLCILIGSWGRLGLAKYCNEIFGQISFLGLRHSTRLYNAVIDALVKSNSLDAAYLKFQQMKADSCTPDSFTYNILIHGVCRMGVVDEAIRLVKQMEGLGYASNVFTYTILIDGFCNAKRVDEAFKVIETMKARNVRTNEATIRSLVHGVFRCVTPGEAFELIIGFIEREPTMGRLACDALLCCLSNNCMPREAGALLRKLGALGYLPNSETFNITITCLLKGLVLHETCEMLDRFIERGMKLGFSTYLMLLEALYKAGKCTDGDRYYSQMVKGGLISNVFSYNMVIDCFCKASMMDKASEAFKELKHRGITPNLVTFNTLMNGHCKDGEVRKIRDLLEMLLEHGFTPDVFTFSSIIDGLCRAKRFEDALSCLSEMIEWGVSPSVVTYNIMIHSLCSIGDVTRSLKLVRKMQRDGVSPDIFSFNALIQSFCRVGKIKKAERLFVSMLTSGLAPDSYTYSAFIKALGELGRYDEAKKLFFSMEQNGCVPDSFTCNLIFDILVKQGQVQEAEKLTKACCDRGIIVKSYHTFSGS